MESRPQTAFRRRIAGLLALVLAFVYVVAPITHYRQHSAPSVRETTQLAHATQSNASIVLAPMVATESTDLCSLCALATVVAPLPVVAALFFLVTSLFRVTPAHAATNPVVRLHPRRGPPRAPPFPV